MTGTERSVGVTALLRFPSSSFVFVLIILEVSPFSLLELAKR